MALPAWRGVGLAALVTLAACAAKDDGQGGVADHHVADPDGDLGTSSAALTASDPVSKATTDVCSTDLVEGLANQLVEEIQCLRPNTMKSIAGVPGIVRVGYTSPWLQRPAADALIAAQKARGVTMRLNSTLRTIPEQYILYRWYRLGRCRNVVTLAAPPGQSNHESGLAIDIQDNAGWRGALQGNGYVWLGANDAVHYDYKGGGTVALNQLAVEAFQRLWNRNNPNDTIGVDGVYGPQTESRVAQSPLGGFKIGAQCNQKKPEDAGADATPEPTPQPPAEQPPRAPDPAPAAAPRPPQGSSSPELQDADGGGCHVTAGRARATPFALLAFVVGALLLARRRVSPSRS